MRKFTRKKIDQNKEKDKKPAKEKWEQLTKPEKNKTLVEQHNKKKTKKINTNLKKKDMNKR